MPDSGAFAPWDGDPAQGLAIANLLRRVAGLAAVHVYELEVTREGGYRCRLWVGDGVERLVGDIPPGMTIAEWRRQRRSVEAPRPRRRLRFALRRR